MPLAGNVDLKSQELRALVKQYGRIAACLPVEKGDPLRTQLLDAVRENYVGDLNRKTTLNNTPVPSFVVTQLCAAQKYAYFCGEPANADADWYSQDSKKLDVVLVLQKDANNTWWLPVPQFQGISRQSSLAWCNHSTDILPVKTVEEMAKNGNSAACGKAIPCHCAEYWQSKKAARSVIGWLNSKNR